MKVPSSIVSSTGISVPDFLHISLNEQNKAFIVKYWNYMILLVQEADNLIFSLGSFWVATGL